MCRKAEQATFGITAIEFSLSTRLTLLLLLRLQRLYVVTGAITLPHRPLKQLFVRFLFTALQNSLHSPHYVHTSH